MIAKLIASGAGSRRRPSRALCAGARGDGGGRPQDQRRLPACAVDASRLRRGRMDTGLDRAANWTGSRAARRRLPGRSPSASRICCGTRMTRRGGRRRRSSEAIRPGARRMHSSSAAARRQQLSVLVDGVATKVEVEWGRPGRACPCPATMNAAAPKPRNLRVVGDGNPLYVLADMRQIELALADLRCQLDRGGRRRQQHPRADHRPRRQGVRRRRATAVAKGDRVAVVEAMKMEHVLHAPRDGTIDKVAVKRRRAGGARSCHRDTG